MNRIARMIALIALVLSCTATRVLAQSAAGEAETVAENVAFTLSWHECVHPDEDPPCSCINEEDRERKCPDCEKWKVVYSELAKGLEFDRQEYAHTAQSLLPRANFFIRDLAERVYGVEYPETEYGFPITTSDLYANPEEYGWIQVNPDSILTGTVISWPTYAGIVLSDSGGIISVLYPGGQAGGTLVSREFEKDDIDAHFLLPEALYENAMVARSADQ